jgi:hypothetical protein
MISSPRRARGVPGRGEVVQAGRRRKKRRSARPCRLGRETTEPSPCLSQGERGAEERAERRGEGETRGFAVGSGGGEGRRRLVLGVTGLLDDIGRFFRIGPIMGGIVIGMGRVCQRWVGWNGEPR